MCMRPYGYLRQDRRQTHHPGIPAPLSARLELLPHIDLRATHEFARNNMRGTRIDARDDAIGCMPWRHLTCGYRRPMRQRRVAPTQRAGEEACAQKRLGIRPAWRARWPALTAERMADAMRAGC